MVKTIKQNVSLDIQCADGCITPPTNRKKHGELLPNTIRCIMCGPSNCGKTNIMMNLLEHPQGVRFKNVYIYSNSLHQPKYIMLEEMLKSIQDINYFPFSSQEQVIPPNETKPHSIFIFDDVVCDKQNNMKLYFSMGRHHAVDSFYLTQTYSSIPKQLIRDNANLMVLFRQDGLNLHHVFNDHVAPDMTYQQFYELCAHSWNHDPYGFLVIDKDSSMQNGRYRNKFDEFFQL